MIKDHIYISGTVKRHDSKIWTGNDEYDLMYIVSLKNFLSDICRNEGSVSVSALLAGLIDDPREYKKPVYSLIGWTDPEEFMEKTGIVLENDEVKFAAKAKFLI